MTAEIACGDPLPPSNDQKLPDGIDVIVRVHDAGRESDLDRALFSLVNQTFRPVHPIIVGQGLSDDGLRQVRSVVDKHDWDYEQVRPTIVNVANDHGKDLRSRLLNVGLSHARYRFFGVLDFDDYLYGHAYEYLVSETIRDRAAISFGNIVANHVRTFPEWMYTLKKIRTQFSGASFDALLDGNFCPIHSFVCDRSVIDAQDLYFDEELTRLEDYDFFLRICSKYRTNFQSRSKMVGVYNWCLEGRNSTDFFVDSAQGNAPNRPEWAKAERRIERLKRLMVR